MSLTLVIISMNLIKKQGAALKLYITYNGKKYSCVLDHKQKQRRYLKLTTRPLGEVYLHRQIWIDNHGEIPKNYHIHHKDEDIYNNRIENLEMMSREDHLNEHKEKRMIWSHSDKNKDQLRKLQPKAIEWMQTEKAKDFYRKKGLEQSKNSEKLTTCVFCQKEFIGVYMIRTPMFCSDKCCRLSTKKKKKTITCVVCGERKETGIYSVAKVCSTGCGNKKRFNEKHKIEFENNYGEFE